jgi:hypothetical protein
MVLILILLLPRPILSWGSSSVSFAAILRRAVEKGKPLSTRFVLELSGFC